MPQLSDERSALLILAGAGLLILARLEALISLAALLLALGSLLVLAGALGRRTVGAALVAGPILALAWAWPAVLRLLT